jgi:hypothetical protein
MILTYSISQWPFECKNKKYHCECWEKKKYQTIDGVWHCENWYPYIANEIDEEEVEEEYDEREYIPCINWKRAPIFDDFDLFE